MSAVSSRRISASNFGSSAVTCCSRRAASRAMSRRAVLSNYTRVIVVSSGRVNRISTQIAFGRGNGAVVAEEHGIELVPRQHVPAQVHDDGGSGDAVDHAHDLGRRFEARFAVQPRRTMLHEREEIDALVVGESEACGRCARALHPTRACRGPARATCTRRRSRRRARRRLRAAGRPCACAGAPANRGRRD